jgi:hypothetical protein
MKVALAIGALVALSGCTNLKYWGWKHVRIEDQVPAESCEYKVQEACGSTQARCFNWYKKRATKFDANTVVIKPQQQFAAPSGTTINNNVVINYRPGLLADYYHCPSKAHD